MTEPEPSPEATAEPPSAHALRRGAVGRLRASLERADPGALAALRKMDTEAPPPAFFRVAVPAIEEVLPRGGALRDEVESRWAVVVRAIAVAQPNVARVPLGEALARAGVAEMRVLRLLEARGAAVATIVRTVVHQLVSKAQPFDPAELADLVLLQGTDAAEPVRRQVARSYYRHQAT